ncbi:MAG: hypothetical protein RIQ94_1160 [Pseudomonadota bacterium]|jgi:hypothetical protein
MIILHLIALIQTCFLPGFILLLLLHRKYLNLETTFTFSFGLSLLCNYLIVFILIALGLYTQVIVVGIFIFEIGVLFALLRINKTKVNPTPKICMDYFRDITSEGYFNNYISSYGKIGLAIIVITFLYLFFLSHEALNKIGDIFQFWDSVVSWNHWATVLANNVFPLDTYHYPLLIPANWSLTYVITGVNWQFLPRTIMPIFLLAMMLTQILLGLRQRNISWFITAIIFSFALSKYNWTDGMVDGSVAFFSWSAILCILMVMEDSVSDNKTRSFILLGSLFVVASAVTKQAGLFMVVIYPAIVFLLNKEKRLIPKEKITQYLVIYLTLVLLVVAPFYILVEYNISNGKSTSEINYVTSNLSLHHNHSYINRIIPALYMYSYKFGGQLVFLALLGFSFYACCHRLQRILFLIVFLPYLLLWAIFFSYDTRNAALSIPILAFVAGYGADKLFVKIKTTDLPADFFSPQLKNAKSIIFTILIIAGLYHLNRQIETKSIETNHIEQQKQLGDPYLNKRLYDYFSKNGKNGEVLVTDYLFFGFLPDLSEHYRSLHNNDAMAIDKLKAADVAYILLTPYSNGDSNKNKLIQYLDAQLTEGKFNLIFTYTNLDGPYKLIKIR